MSSKLYAFLWRDLVEQRSYRLPFLMRNLRVLLPLALLFFMQRMFDGVSVDAVSRYGGDYVAFLLVGVVVAGYAGTALSSFSGGIRRWQTAGTLEILFLTRAGIFTILFGWSMYPIIRTTLTILAYMAAGIFILGITLGNINVSGALFTLVLTITSMAGIGIIIASITLVLKQGDPFSSLYTILSTLLSGSIYPLDVLPAFLQTLAQAFPLTHAIEAMRMAVLQGKSIEDMAPQLGALVIFSAVLLPLGLFLYSFAVQRSRQEGSLTQY